VLQLPTSNTANIRLEFDSLQFADNVQIPYGFYGRGGSLEPIATTFPKQGAGGGTQVIVNSEIKLKRIVDITTGEILKEFD
jgi:hypothetical protein